MIKYSRKVEAAARKLWRKIDNGAELSKQEREQFEALHEKYGDKLWYYIKLGKKRGKKTKR